MKAPVSHDKEFNLYPKGNMEVLSLLNQGVIVPELYLKNGNCSGNMKTELLAGKIHNEDNH